MTISLLLGATLSGGVLLSGCAATSATMQNDAARMAATLDRERCGGSEPGSLPVDPHQAERAEPVFSHVHSGRNDSEARLRGAELRVHVQPGMTSEWLERQIACHEVKAALGEAQARADDPFLLPDGWVDSSVRSEAGSFLVTLRPKNPDRAKEVLGRAEAFVARR
jgi:hypothetical protein